MMTTAKQWCLMQFLAGVEAHLSHYPPCYSLQGRCLSCKGRPSRLAPPCPLNTRGVTITRLSLPICSLGTLSTSPWLQSLLNSPLHLLSSL